MNKIRKYLVFLIFFIITLCSGKLVCNAASASISASTTNPTPGQIVTVTANVTARSLEFTIIRCWKNRNNIWVYK